MMTTFQKSDIFDKLFVNKNEFKQIILTEYQLSRQVKNPPSDNVVILNIVAKLGIVLKEWQIDVENIIAQELEYLKNEKERFGDVEKMQIAEGIRSGEIEDPEKIEEILHSKKHAEINKRNLNDDHGVYLSSNLKKFR